MVHHHQLGRNLEEIQTEEKENNQVCIAPTMLIIVLFFAVFVLKATQLQW